MSDPLYVALFTIDPVWTWHRYMLNGGRIMDVRSPYAANSTDRALVLKEAQRLWGGKKDDWKIEGVTFLADEDPGRDGRMESSAT
jgi:hypothetical protein